MKPKVSTLALAVVVAGCATAGPRFATAPLESAPSRPVAPGASPVKPPRPPSVASAAPVDDGWSPILAVGSQRLEMYDDGAPSAMQTIQLGHRQPTPHVVAPGETLFAIAREHLGSGGRWRELLDANPRLGDSGSVRAGQVVMVP